MSTLGQANADRFNAVATSWDTDPARAERARAIARAIVGAIPLTGRERMMEVGSGTGILTALLAPSVGEVLAVDGSAGMLEVLRTKARELHLDNVRALEADLSEGVPEGPFDLIVSAMTMHHIEDVPELLRGLSGVLAPGGHLAIADLEEEDGSFHADLTGIAHFGFRPEAFAQWLEEAGLEQAQIHPAHVMEKTAGDGKRRRYPIFLATARRPQGR